jgi:hypothetical protein
MLFAANVQPHGDEGVDRPGIYAEAFRSQSQFLDLGCETIEETLGNTRPPTMSVSGRVSKQQSRAANARTEFALRSRTLLYRFSP